MIICGLKLTHDGAVALLEDDRLVFSVEMEKIGNNPRYSEVTDAGIVAEILAGFGYRVEDVDHWVVDGWDGRDQGTATLSDQGTPATLALAPYRENERITDLLQTGRTGRFTIAGRPLTYSSYLHVTGHLASAYCSSPFAPAGEPSFVLVWDGGMFPRLYFADPERGVENGGALFPLIGHAYATAAHHFGPFRRTDESKTVDDLSVAGKLMAYIALGTVRAGVMDVLREEFSEHFEGPGPKATAYRAAIGGWGSNAEPSLSQVHDYFSSVRRRLAGDAVQDEDVLASVHQFLEDLLVERVAARVREWKGEGPWNLCFVGGCALNIKWNSALRAHPAFASVWVPPFPNDSGSAIGTAAAHLIATEGIGAIDWNPRLGPAVKDSAPLAGWTSTPCTPEELARVLHETGEPVVVIDGRAELGPRALGGRSILAAATDPAMKELLNKVKNREHYRPVAPICLTEEAPAVFSPGTPDPHMLFDHDVRPEWAARIPAVVHLDGSARLQTVGAEDDPTLRAVLREYHRLSGIPVLCNTSANFNGSGFFPDVASAMRWGRLDRIWSDNVLHARELGPAAPEAADGTR
ncbi:carbamoyltransferase N-terminal domain-containing protein [Streptomyces sp. CB03238]|uniref:carbamoyltransferase N-terminal domain-containing protein n=1 Tax=Streptomyces sp. CB03238 TaxID=1907777 RepID=UPI000A11F2A4|nr:carbamoyltransferase N-terminal domain-containing protein [Streptomyces sp. CB03238]ORT57360.1 nodulation protein U [Streptomyces sp. CB03238]